MSKNKNNGSIFRVERFAKAGIAVAVAASMSSIATAGEPIYFDHGGKLSWSATASYGIGMRMSKRDDLLKNGSEGNRNFDQHSLTTNRVGILGELTYTQDATWGEWGGVLRGSSFYDDVYHSKNDNTADYSPAHGGAYNKFSDSAKRYSGGRSKFLDAYLFSDIALPADQYLSVKAGRHMVAWGEGLYYPGVNGMQGKVDVVKASTPGTETKEVLLPTGQVSVDWNISPSFGLSAYYQYEWAPNELAPIGSFNSSNDATGPSPSSFYGQPYAGITTPDGSGEPSDSGQFGLRAMYRPNYNWEFSAFYIQYHDKNPARVELGFGATGPTTYKQVYFDEIKLAGFSGSTSFGDTQVSTEVSYRDGAPVAVQGDSLGRSHVEGKGYQAQISAMHAFGNYPWARGTILIGEIVNTGVTSVEGDGKYSYDQSNAQGGVDYQTSSSTAYTLSAIFEYPGVISGWDFTVPISFSHVVDGVTPLQGAVSGGEGNMEMSVGTSWQYAGNLELDLGYAFNLSSADLRKKRNMTDRDELTFSAKYSF